MPNPQLVKPFAQQPNVAPAGFRKKVQAATPAGQQPNPNFDQSKPGAAEDAYTQHSGAFFQPSQVGQYWNSVAGNANTPTQSAGAYQQYQQSQPADMSGYYNRAEDRATGRVNDQMAARGMYGSSYGAGQATTAITDLEAQRAKDEAGYGLQRAQVGGQLAGQADQTGLSKTLGYGQLAGGADAARISGASAGMSAAGMAQGARRQRTQDAFDNIWRPSAAIAGMTGDAYHDVAATDQGGFEAQQALALGIPTAAQAQSDREQSAVYQAWDDADRIYKGISSRGMDLGGKNPGSKQSPQQSAPTPQQSSGGGGMPSMGNFGGEAGDGGGFMPSQFSGSTYGMGGGF
jgi:hypothetical protein